MLTDERKPTANIVLAIGGLNGFVSTFLLNLNFRLRINSSAKNRHNAKPKTVERKSLRASRSTAGGFVLATALRDCPLTTTLRHCCATDTKPPAVIGYSMATVQPSTDSAKNEQTVTQNRTKKPYLRYEHLIQYG